MVYGLKRTAAFLVDYGIIWLFIMWSKLPVALFLEKHSIGAADIETLNHYSLLAPFFAGVTVFGIMTGIWGRTPGKLLTFLKVVRHDGSAIGMGAGIAREVLKGFSWFTVILPIFFAFGVFCMAEAAYDKWLSCEVFDARPFGSTKTQRDWRNHWKGI